MNTILQLLTKEKSNIFIFSYAKIQKNIIFAIEKSIKHY
ncbi:hypothetical protein HMPREF9296_2602 [Prevotella disiens FB035-09AN]|uniref:Uncharacterized protein n=1 Tax=Prevotella disiens FB035-09AN TaxID=866771 RepID=E1KP64_9BACT|nr:hypothetical protein HMPREF9296_2602 [Prevotella disiens FB035-09AN]